MKYLTPPIFVLCIMLSSFTYAQLNNPNKLHPCPKPDYSKSYDVGAGGRTEKWNNCLGRYQVELDTYAKGNVLDGEWHNGLLNGQATYYYLANNEFKGDIYVGEYKNGKMHGQGTYTFASGGKYIGELKEGKMDGRATIIFGNGKNYVGDIKDNKFHGQGTVTYANGNKYVGEFKDDQKHGLGIFTFANGITQEGIWEKDNFIRQATVNLPNQNKNITTNTDRTDIDRERQPLAENRRYLESNPNKLPPCPKPDFTKAQDIGVGGRTEKWNNCWGRYSIEKNNTHIGDVLEGEWRSGGLDGHGIYNYKNGSKYIGELRNGKKHGRGTYTAADGEYVGEFKDDKRNGQGTYTLANGDKFVGEFQDGKKNGQGTFTFADGGGFTGEWKDGLPNGKGIETYADGRSSKEGVFEKGKFVRAEKFNPPSLTQQTDISINEERRRLDADRQALERDRQRLTEERNRREQERLSSKLSLQTVITQPDANGVVIISVRTNADTSSLKVNGEEQGGKIDGNYIIKKVARIGQDTKFTIVATDINNNTESTIITVARQAVSPSSNQSASLKPENVKRAASRDAVAIIIGIQNYKRVSKADFANNDAKEFYEYAIRGLGIKPENIKLLLDEEADEIEIVKAFQNWLPLQVTKNKTDVFVFYSGHGLPSEDGQSLYFLPYGVDKQFLSRTAVGQKDVVSALLASKPKSVTMFIDSCYSGLSRTGETLLASARPISLKSKEIGYPPEFTVISASSPDQISSSSPELQHGIFSFYLMKGMEGDADINNDGKITAGEMQQYVSDKVQRQAMSMNRKQEPQLIGDPNRVLVGR